MKLELASSFAFKSRFNSDQPCLLKTVITFLPRAPDTNSFVWNNLRVKHGSVYDPAYKKILAVVVCPIDIERYSSLMETSINMYKDYCIVSNNSIENYVNI